MATAPTAKADRFWPEVPDHVWGRIREEFTLPELAEVEQRYAAAGTPDTVRDVVRVFIGEGTFCPGFQFRAGQLDGRVLDLAARALELKVPHNIFAAWMMAPLALGEAVRPVDALEKREQLQGRLEAFADRYRPRAADRAGSSVGRGRSLRLRMFSGRDIAENERPRTWLPAPNASR